MFLNFKPWPYFTYFVHGFMANKTLVFEYADWGTDKANAVLLKCVRGEIFVTGIKVLSVSSQKETEDPACLRCCPGGRVSCLSVLSEVWLLTNSSWILSCEWVISSSSSNHSPGPHKDELSTQSGSHCDLCHRLWISFCQTQTHLRFSETVPPARIPSHCRVVDDDSHSKMFYFVISKMLVSAICIQQLWLR